MKGKVFSTHMVQAILQGRKTQFREVMKVQPKDNQPWIIGQMIDKADRKNFGKLRWVLRDGSYSGGDNRYFSWPYKVGDVLYVKETYQHTEVLNIHPTDDNYGYVYKADGQPWEDFEGWKWKSPMFMPEKAARLFIIITGLNFERLGDISEEDAKAEGIELLDIYDFPIYKDYLGRVDGFQYPPNSFISLWQSINGEDSWNANPWVWAYTFEIYQP